MHKKGSELNEIINPLIDRFLQTRQYYELCVKFDMVNVCHVNEFFPSVQAPDLEKSPYLMPTAKMFPSQNCSTGYCQCPSSV